MAGLASSFLGVRMDKDWRVRASDWEADVLSDRQTLYAANDALLSINVAMQGKAIERYDTSVIVVYAKQSVFNFKAVCTSHSIFFNTRQSQSGCMRGGVGKDLASIGRTAKRGGFGQGGDQTLLEQARCPLQVRQGQGRRRGQRNGRHCDCEVRTQYVST